MVPSHQRWSQTIIACRLVRQAKQIKSDAPSTVSEQKASECIIIRDLQKQEYEKEIEQLKKGKQLTKNNKLYHVFIDTDGIVKVGGRFRHSSLSDSLKHPIVIPQDQHVT